MVLLSMIRPPQSNDPGFCFQPPLAKFLFVSYGPMFEFKAYFGLIIKRKSVFKLGAVVSRKAVFRTPGTQFGKQIEQVPPGRVVARSIIPALVFAPKTKQPG